jgi:hypothetical protein
MFPPLPLPERTEERKKKEERRKVEDEKLLSWKLPLISPYYDFSQHSFFFLKQLWRISASVWDEGMEEKLKWFTC